MGNATFLQWDTNECLVYEEYHINGTGTSSSCMESVTLLQWDTHISYIENVTLFQWDTNECLVYEEYHVPSMGHNQVHYVWRMEHNQMPCLWRMPHSFSRKGYNRVYRVWRVSRFFKWTRTSVSFMFIENATLLQ